ncbi:MAG: histidine--tRNA ligase [Actinobacteria bacterium]|nr:histidine--tRNA ligase [Actinomycetota bacterium]
MKFEKIQAPKGVREYLPPESSAFDWVRTQLIAPAAASGYQLMELPVFEDTNVFTRGVGESTDVVSKEMYTFEDRGGRSITLRPEGTAGVMRAVIENNLDRGQLPVKVWYSGQFFRAERPQAGRYRQFYQVGIEAIGVEDPAIDAEVIAIADRGFKNLGLKNYRLDITSLGDAASRAAHRVDLMKFIGTLDLDEATAARAALNPLRLFDDKRPEMQEAMKAAPLLMDYLSAESSANFTQVLKYLDALKISYVLNPRMVRGLDYYTGTTFEFVHSDLGAQAGIGGGGRYDGLMETLGGQSLSGIGFGLGVDRALLAAVAEKSLPQDQFTSDLLIIPLGDDAMTTALITAQELRASGIKTEIAFGDRSLKGAMKGADKSGTQYVVVFGESELSSGVVNLKRMRDGDTSSVKIAQLKDVLRETLSR